MQYSKLRMRPARIFRSVGTQNVSMCVEYVCGFKAFMNATEWHEGSQDGAQKTYSTL